MSWTPSCAEGFDRVYAEEALARILLPRRAARPLARPGAPTSSRRREAIPPEHLEPATLYLCQPRGRQLAPCPGSAGHLCCGYWTLDLYLGCRLGCSYCILRSYLNFAP